MIQLKSKFKLCLRFLLLTVIVNMLSYSKTWNFQKLKAKGIDNSFIYYMDGKFITDPTSPQFSFIHGVKPMNYGIYNKNNHYLVAVSPVYGQIGDEIIVKFNNGIKIIVYIGDHKRPSETKKLGYGIHEVSSNRGCQVEFIVDELLIPQIVQKTGDFASYIKRYSGGIQSIENKRIL